MIRVEFCPVFEAASQATILVSAIVGKVQFWPPLPVSSQLKPELKRPNHFDLLGGL